LEEFGCICVKFAWGEEAEVTFEAADADEASQLDVGRLEYPAVLADELFFGCVFGEDDPGVAVF
jgi:hypothetical protein